MSISRYDEMMSFLPWYYRDSRIMNGIILGDAEEIEAAQGAILHILSQFYVDTADERGIGMWEQELGITPAESASLELRKTQVKARLQRPAIMTPRRIESIVNLFVEGGAAHIVEAEGRYHFSIEIPFGKLKWPREARQALEEAKPAHLGYDICYTLYGGELEDTAQDEVADDAKSDFVTAGLMSFSDDVPYGIPIRAYKHDGTLKRAGTLNRDRMLHRDGSVNRRGFSLDGAPQWGKHLDYIFRSGGRSERNGALQRDGRCSRSGEKPWKIEYVGQMEELSVLVITLARDGAATFEDDLKDFLPRSRIIERDGSGRHGSVNHPVDTDGALTITRARQRNGRIQRDGGDINLHDGSIRRGGMFRRDGGGIKRRVDIISDRLSGVQSITRGKKEAPLYLKYPEIYDTYTGTEERGAGEALLLDGFADDMAQRLLHGGNMQRIGSYTRGADRQSVYESGGIEIIRCKIRDGSIDRAGGWTLKRDSSLRHSGESTHDKGGNRRDTTRHLETL